MTFWVLFNCAVHLWDLKKKVGHICTEIFIRSISMRNIEFVVNSSMVTPNRLLEMVSQQKSLN